MYRSETQGPLTLTLQSLPNSVYSVLNLFRKRAPTNKLVQCIRPGVAPLAQGAPLLYLLQFAFLKVLGFLIG